MTKRTGLLLLVFLSYFSPGLVRYVSGGDDPPAGYIARNIYKPTYQGPIPPQPVREQGFIPSSAYLKKVGFIGRQIIAKEF